MHHRRNSHYFSLITALIRNRKIRARGFFRAVFFFPVPLSPVVVAPIWKWILLRDGILNAIQGELDVQWHYILAIAVVTPLPVVLVFAFLQRFIATGIARTGMRLPAHRSAPPLPSFAGKRGSAPPPAAPAPAGRTYLAKATRRGGSA